MIPKVIHYCWFGSDKKPNYFYKCYKSWIKYFPEFEILEWNESNTDLTHPFLKEAVQQKKWAFVSDFIRIQKLIEFGGIYLDTDMLFLKSFDLSFLTYHYFLGMEDSQSLSAGVIGSVQNGEFLQLVFEVYQNQDQFEFEQFAIPSILTKTFQKYSSRNPKPGLIDKGLVLSYQVFYPLPYKLKKFHWKKFITQESLSVHLWAGSWLIVKDLSFRENLISFLKYQISRFYVPPSLIQYSRNI